MRPLIKWTGGKYNEFPLFARYIPVFNNYYEPFLGGGGVFFALQPSQQSFLNDKSADLIRFYSGIGSTSFQSALLEYAAGWEQAGRFSAAVVNQLADPFSRFVQSQYSPDQLKAAISATINSLSADAQWDPLFSERLIVDISQFTAALIASLADKCKRIKAIITQKQRVFTTVELNDHIETGIKSGLYLYMRRLMNQHAKGHLQLSPAMATANWYFVREFCYASMFRFNSNGGFNIPYGGIAYNKKNFRQKVNNIFSPAVQQLFSAATFTNLDFQDFLQTYPPKPDDFVFLDPPYDSEFSEYDQNAFTRTDQQRLATTLLQLSCKWMLVIKETSFIRDLYTQPGIHLITFDKTYTYNVRGRNNRYTKHLIIVNYSI